MERGAQDLLRVDDVLLRTGWIGLLVVLAVSAIGLLYALAEAAPGAEAVALGFLREYGAWIGLALLCPAAALRVGWAMRRRERRIAAIWRLLRRHVEISVPELLANSDLRAADVDRAVRLLNGRGLGFYVWDREAGVLQDGRLRSLVLHVEKCEQCGGAVSLDLPLGTRRVPACPYCGDPVAVEAFEARRQREIEALREERLEERKAQRALEGTRVPFSIPLFAVLLCVCWPAALAYLWWRYASARECGADPA